MIKRIILKKLYVPTGLLFILITGSSGAQMSENIAPRAVNFQQETPKDFERSDIRNLEYKNDLQGYQLIKKDSTNFLSEGSITSPIINGDFPFNNIVLSWDAAVPKGTYIMVETQVNDDSSSWSPWFEMANFSIFDKDSVSQRKSGAAGRVVVDELRLRNPVHQFRYRVTLQTKDPTLSPTLLLVGISYADTKNKIPVHDELTMPKDTTAPIPAWVRDLNVPYRSQTVLPRSIAGSTCHPTSLSMVLEFYGTNLPTTEVAENVWDPVNKIFGNWIFNAGYASYLGYRSYVIRCSSFDFIKKQIAKGYPAIISIAFKQDTLTGSPIHGTNGHIIVVRGFTKDGDPICNDPAARTEEKGHVVYKKEELERAWLDHSGAVVIVEPRNLKS